MASGIEGESGSDVSENAEGAKVEGSGRGPRSETQYPYFGLGRALDIVDAVRKAGGNDASNSDVLRELKVGKTDRLWAYGIPAATQFGLIERVGRGEDGRLKLTELAGRIVLPGSPEEARLAKIAAFKTPDLYAKLLEKFAGHMPPSKEGLRNILHREFKIVESMAPNAADAFLESLKAAEVLTASGVIIAGSVSPSAPPGGPAAPPAAPAPQPPPTNAQTITVPADFIVYKCKIGKNNVIEIPLPATFKKSQVEKLYAFLLTQVDDDDEVET